MHIGMKRKEDCCGCGACAALCPKSAIRMRRDSEGFLYPAIDGSMCIDCGLCISRCSFQKLEQDIKSIYINSYAVRHKDIKVLSESQSGGAFTALSDGCFKHDFVVWGMVSKGSKVFCTYAINELQRNRMRGSKYVQGDIFDTYQTVEKQIREKKKVLFSGTPCQVAAVKAYLESCNVSLDYFYSIDIICHGTPSPRFWEDYVAYRGKQLHTYNMNIKFRDKTRLGWHSHEESMEVKETGKKIYSHQYANVFYSHLTLRPSCYYCHYAYAMRIADVTIGDCWGIEKTLPQFDDNRGESIVFVHTRKGREIFSYAEPFLKKVSIDPRDYQQPNMKRPSPKPEVRSKFWKEYEKSGFAFVLKKYSREPWKSKVKRAVALVKNKGLWEDSDKI